MSNLFELLEPELAEEVESLTLLTYELRENRRAVLRSHGVADEAELLEKIRSGDAAEHPTYEHYLAARILDDTREAARALIVQRLKERNT